MSVTSSAVSSRLAQARRAGDPVRLRASEAADDALALLREAAPAPDQAVDLAGVAAVCQTFFLRSRFTVSAWRDAVSRGAPVNEVPEDLALAAMTGGYLLGRAPGLLPPVLRDELAAVTDRQRDGRFAFAVAGAHQMEAVAFAVASPAAQAAPGTPGTPRAPDTVTVQRVLAALDRAIAWSGRACDAFTDQEPPLEEFAEVRMRHMKLLAARFDLAGDLAALSSAAAAGLAVLRRLAGRAEHAALLATAAETVARSACALGVPPETEARHAIGAVPPGALTELTTVLLRSLDAVYATPVTWVGEHDARAGLLLAQEALKGGHPGVRAAAVRRLRAALSLAPSDLPARPQLAFAVTTVSGGQYDLDPGIMREAARFVGEAGFHQVLARQIDGGQFPPEAGMAAVLLDLTTSMITAWHRDQAPVTSQLTDSFASWVERLPADYPDRDLYAALPAALADPEAAPDALAAVTAAVPWSGVAAKLRGIATGWDEEKRQVALSLASALEGSMAQVAAALPHLARVHRDLTEPKQAPGSQGASGAARPDLAETIDHLREIGNAVPLVGAESSGYLKALDALSGTVSPDEFQASLKAMIRFGEGLAGTAERTEFAFAFGAVMMQGIREAHLPAVRQLFALDQETRLAAQSVLATVRQPLADRPGIPREATVIPLMADLLLSVSGLAIDADVTQLDRMDALLEQATGLMRQAGNQAGNQAAADTLAAFIESATLVAGLAVPQMEAPSAGRTVEASAESVAALQRRLTELQPGHPSHQALQPQLALALARHSALLRDSDPERAQQLTKEAETLLSVAALPEPLAAPFRQVFEAALAGPSRTRPDPTPPTAAGQAGPSPAAEAPPDTREGDDAGPAALAELAATLTRSIAGIADVESNLLKHYEDTVEQIARMTDRGADSRTVEHVIATHEFAMPNPGIAVALNTAALSTALAGLATATERLETDQASADDFAPPGIPGSVAGPVVDRAAALAERSRGLLIFRQLEDRTDLSELRAAHPELAAEFERLAARISAVPDGSGEVGDAERIRVDKFRADREMDALIDRVRSAPGFGTFLGPLAPSQLRELAADGPVVMLVYPGSRVAADAGDTLSPWAFVVSRDAITAIRVDVAPDAVRAAARRWRNATDLINARGADRLGPKRLRRAATDLTEVLSWTWHRLVAPVLDAASLPREHPGGSAWPRVWWIPDGPFHALPLHAAQCREPGCPEEGCGAALDSVVSSYVPSFRMLDQARHRASGDDAGRGRPLIVASTEDDLPGAEAAAQEAGRRLLARRAFIGPAATRRVVLSALSQATWAHFGCHAISDPTEPSGGVLHLPSGEPLTVREICRARPLAARLAFLTACGTARTAERLASEAIHLSSAFLLAGFSEAVGTLWEIESQDALRVTTEFYQRITGEQPEIPAAALHHCVRKLRHERPDALHVWSAYVHAGA